jgi:hypothetical protein
MMTDMEDGTLEKTNGLLKELLVGIKKSADRGKRVATEVGSVVVSEANKADGDDVLTSFVDAVAVLFKTPFGISRFDPTASLS